MEKVSAGHNLQALKRLWAALALLLCLCAVAAPLRAAVMPSFQSLPAISAGLDAPTAVAVGGDERIYVAEASKNRVLAFSAGGQYQATLSGLDMPISLAVGLGGEIFVGNAGRGSVDIYGSDFSYIGSLGAGDLEFEQPTGITLDAGGNIYVIDGGTDQVRVFAPDYSPSFSFGGTGTANGLFKKPSAVVVNEAASELVVSDLAEAMTVVGYSYTMSARVQVFGLDGSFKRSFKTLNADGALVRPLGVAVDTVGRIYVADSYQNLVAVYDSVGTHLGDIFDTASPLNNAVDMAFAPGTGRLFVVSLNTPSVETYGIDTLFADIQVEPTSRDFGGIDLGSASGNQVITVSNAGEGQLSLGSAVIQGNSPGDFSVQGDGCSGQNLAPAASCTLEIQFAPSDVGQRMATLDIPSNDLYAPISTVALSGSGQADQYLLKVEKTGSSGGTVQGAGLDCGATCELSYVAGTTVTLVATPRADAVFDGWGGGCDGAGSCVVTLDSNTTVTAKFSPIPKDYYTITASSGPGGRISLLGQLTLTAGDDLAYMITPNTGYHIADVLVDGMSIGVVSEYSFDNISADHTISVSFASDSFTITAVANGNGSVTPNGEVVVAAGSDYTFNILPASYYQVVDVRVDGVSVGAVTEYNFTNIAANHSIEADFAYASQLSSIMEIGEVTVDHNWKRVDFKGTYAEPVVVAKPASLNDIEPAVVRVRNVDATGFELRIQEWDYLDGIHGEEQVSYIVMERGSHLLKDGTRVEAGKFNTAATESFDRVSFVQPFAVTPVIIGGIVSYYDDVAVAGRVRNIDVNGFDYRLQEQEANIRNGVGQHGAENIAYIAWEPSIGIDGYVYEVGLTPRYMNHTFRRPITFAAEYEEAPLFLADLQTTGRRLDTANLRWRNKTATNIEVKVDEEQSANLEMRHGREAVGYIVLYDFKLDPEADSDGDGLLDVDEVNIYSTKRRVADTDNDGINDGDEKTYWGDAWNADIDNDGLINLLDYDADNDGHGDGVERLAGSDAADPGSFPSLMEVVEVGEVTVDHSWVRVSFEHEFIDPVVVAKPASLNDAEPAVVRVRNVDATGFDVRMQEWDYLDGLHGEEQVSYVAIERGNYVLAGGARVEAGRFETASTRRFASIRFNKPFAVPPVLLASVASFNDAAAVTGRMGRIKTTSFSYGLQEQELNVRSLIERDHGVETIDYIAWEPSVGQEDGLAYEVGRTARVAMHWFTPISFSTGFINEPIFVADMQQMRDRDVANLRWRNKGVSGVEVLVSEEQSYDAEMLRRRSQDVGYIVIDPLSVP